MKAFLSKHYPVIVLVLVMIFAFVIRAYHFNEWLYFKWDQGRDSQVIAQAVEKGPGYLPLLGPRATKVNKNGDYLRLGPAYFYFQYASARLFGSIQPPVLAYPDIFFGVMVIPLLYLLLRILFSRPLSLLLGAVLLFWLV